MVQSDFGQPPWQFDALDYLYLESRVEALLSSFVSVKVLRPISSHLICTVLTVRTVLSAAS